MLVFFQPPDDTKKSVKTKTVSSSSTLTSLKTIGRVDAEEEEATSSASKPTSKSRPKKKRASKVVVAGDKKRTTNPSAHSNHLLVEDSESRCGMDDYSPL